MRSKSKTTQDLKFLLGCCALLGAAALAPAQSVQSANEAHKGAAAAPAAYVYVSSLPKNGSTHQIVGYLAGADGSLTAIPGSPFAEDVESMAVNGKYLMAASSASPTIDAFTIEANGALHYSATTEYAKFNAGKTDDCGAAGPIFFDHTGTWLYAMEFDGSDACANNIYASFKVNKSNGALSYLGLADTGTFPGVVAKATSTGDNRYAYSANNSYCMYFELYGFKRGSNGELSSLNLESNLPTAPGASVFVPSFAVADPANHLAVAMQPANPPECADGPTQLAVYTVDAAGKASTTSTAKTMPVSAVANVFDMRMDPTGKLLAVGGQEGLQIFHFNGAHPITHDTGLLTASPINEMFWDNGGHLYAVSQAAGKLFVYTITPTGYEAAPGSPHAISAPLNLIVQPLPVFAN